MRGSAFLLSFSNIIFFANPLGANRLNRSSFLFITFSKNKEEQFLWLGVKQIRSPLIVITFYVIRIPAAVILNKFKFSQTALSKSCSLFLTLCFSLYKKRSYKKALTLSYNETLI